MLKLKIDLYNRKDRYTKKIPVIIRFGNIEVLTQFPKIGDKMVNFKYDYSKAYEIESQGKVNTRFSYPYSVNYIKSGDAGNQKLYAKLNRLQRFILSLINKDSIFHKHTYKILIVFLGLFASIPLWIPLFCSDHSENNQLQEPSNQRNKIDSPKETDSLRFVPNDSLTESDTTTMK